MKKLLASPFLAAALIVAQFIPMSASAQSSASDFTSATRYDDLGREVGTIAPDPDGTGGNDFLATRTTYDNRGNVTKVETGELQSWKSETVLPADWGSHFDNHIHTTVDSTYDAADRKLTDKVSDSSGNAISLTQYSYDDVGRLECTAVRMNPAAYGSLPPSACALGTQGSNGPDRITKTIYDDAGQVLQIRKAVGTSIEIADATYSYTDNGQIKEVVDANGNRAEQQYDNYDRKSRWVFPSKSGPTSFDDATPATAMLTAGALNNGDYEEYTYDANGNRLTLRKRDGSLITFTYDDLNRVTKKDLPNTRQELPSTHRRDVYYGYDLRGMQSYVRFGSHTGVGVEYAYDGFGRLTAETQNSDGNLRTVSSQYDANGNRTRMTYADGGYVNYTYDKLNRYTGASWWHATSGGTIGLSGVTYNSRGLLQGLGIASSSTDFTYDNAGRMNSLGFDFAGTNNDVTWSYTRNSASQILSESQTNDAYSWDGFAALDRDYTTNGLNQYTGVGLDAYCYDANGNLTADGTSVYLYDYENRLVQKRVQVNTNCSSLSYTGTLEANLHYDPTGRLYQLGGGTHRFLYDGNALVAEYSASGTILRRYAHATNVEADDPLAWWEGANMNCQGTRFLHADPRGSIVGLADCWGARQVLNTYDEFGIPDLAAGNDIATKGRFRYTGQLWIPELGMYYYKARIYSPQLGRFLQTDPIGYEDQFNLYAYVGNDPINGIDPSGLAAQCGTNFDSDIAEKSITFCDGLPLNGNDSGSQGEQGSDDVIDRVADDLLERGEGATDELADQVVTRYELGVFGETYVANMLEEDGYDIIDEGLYVWTTDGHLRIVDLVVEKDGKITFVEVKVNTSQYTKTQRKKDKSIAEEGGYVNPNSDASERLFGDWGGGSLPWVAPTPTKLFRLQCKVGGLICSRK